MAKLVYHWPLDDGAGTTCRELVSGANTLAITSVGGYPQWQPDNNGLCFGSAIGGTRLTDATNLPRAKSTIDSTCLTGRDPISMSIWVNFNGLSISRPLIGVMQAANTDNDYERFQQMLYIGTNGVPIYGFNLLYIASIRREAIVGSASLNGTTGWHHILGYQNNGTPGYFEAKLYVDGKLDGRYTNPAYGRPGTSLERFKIGSGTLQDTLMVDLFPYTSLTSSNGAFPGFIRDARILCGELTDEEVPPIYNPPKTSSIMFSCNT